MFTVTIKCFVKLDGCPESGLAAIDWRREHDLPDEPTNAVKLGFAMRSESLCRQFDQLCDRNGDIVIDTTPANKFESHGPHSKFTPQSSAVADFLATTSGSGGRSLYDTYVTAEAVFPFVSGGSVADADVARLLNEMLACGIRHKQAVEKDRAKAEQEAAARAAESERMKQKAEAESAMRTAEMAEWIKAHGSDRLKRCFEEGIKCNGIYRDERFATDRPGWEWYEEVGGYTDPPNNPPSEAFELLDEARKTSPDAKLMSYYEGNRMLGFVAQAEFLGKDIVFGLDKIGLDESYDEE